MNAEDVTASPGDPLPVDDRLLNLQLRVARRADELLAEATRSAGNAVAYWSRAEREILGLSVPTADELELR